jgi:O-antigen ligase
MAESSPLLGVGAGNFDARFREFTVVWRFRIPRGHAHNAYLQALAQAGIVGLVSYLALLLVVGQRIVRSVRQATDAVSRSLAVGVAAVTAAVAVHNLVDYLHVLSLGLQLSVVWALLGAASGKDRTIERGAIG